MADDAKEEALPKGRVVYLGTIGLAGGREGELWITEALATGAATVEFLRKQGSAFAKSRKSYDVGGVYEVGVRIEDGRLAQMQGAKVWKAMTNSDSISALALIEKGKAQEKATQAARAKAVKNTPTSRLLDEIALIISKAPSGQEEIALQGFVSEIRQRSHQMWRKRR